MLDSERASAPTVPRQQHSGSRLQRLWRALRSPSNHWSILSLAALGALVGVFGIVTLNVALHATATNTFCAACHAQNAALDWEQSSHYRNRTGFIAGCGDCHVPQHFFARMAREGRVPREILSQFSGKISTP
ncbi:MAG: NapC/NirT family cytochrome c, partial [Gemmatimonadaceae bacterium]